jgi:hypothetical protein
MQLVLFEKELETRWLLTALSRIAGSFPSEVAALSFLVSNLRESVAVETNCDSSGLSVRRPSSGKSRDRQQTFPALGSNRWKQLEII